jgi:excisionase family DNA binding protein
VVNNKIASSKPTKNQRGPLEDLETHPEAYVTIGELARYWLVSRKQIYKQIEAGTLPAIRLGPRLLRIGTADALAFERRANMRTPPAQHNIPAHAAGVSAPLRRRG